MRFYNFVVIITKDRIHLSPLVKYLVPFNSQLQTARCFFCSALYSVSYWFNGTSLLQSYDDNLGHQCIKLSSQDWSTFCLDQLRAYTHKHWAGYMDVGDHLVKKVTMPYCRQGAHLPFWGRRARHWSPWCMASATIDLRLSSHPQSTATAPLPVLFPIPIREGGWVG